jgi:dTDP-4-dehydrorhamnose reductase
VAIGALSILSDAKQRHALIIGSSGLIAPALAKRMQNMGWRTTQTSRVASAFTPFDLARPDYFALPDYVDAVFLIAAETSLRRCELESLATQKINVITPIQIAQKYAAVGAQVLMLSSNLIFDGSIPWVSPTAKRQPGCVYGAQKVELEDALAALPGPATILRITKVAESLKPLLTDWAMQLKSGNPINAFSDMFCAPISLKSVVEILAQSAHQKCHGTFQHSGDADLSYATIAIHLCSFLKVPEQLVQPALAGKAVPAPVVCPRNTTLAETLSPMLETGCAEDVLTSLLSVFRAV